MSLSSTRTVAMGFMAAVLLLILNPSQGSGKAPPAVGDTLSELGLTAPESSRDRAYLGIGDRAEFVLRDVETHLIVLEIMGVYCPQCHKQRPHINRLFHRIQAHAGLASRVKFLGIASGSTPMETAYYVKQFKVPYPILVDESFVAHKTLGEPRTPFNMVVTREGKVLFTHLGIIENMDTFFTTLKQMAGVE